MKKTEGLNDWRTLVTYFHVGNQRTGCLSVPRLEKRQPLAWFLNGEQVAGDINPPPPNFFGGFANIITLGGNAVAENGFIGLVDDFKVMGTSIGFERRASG